MIVVIALGLGACAPKSEQTEFPNSRQVSEPTEHPEGKKEDSEEEANSETTEDAINTLYPVSVDRLPNLIPDDDLKQFKLALKRQLIVCKRQDLEQTHTFGERVVTRKEYCLDTANEFVRLVDESTDVDELWEKAKTRFDWYLSPGQEESGEAFFTGYYLPIMNGRKEKSDEFHYPIYKRPNDLVHVDLTEGWRWRRLLESGGYTPYYDRYEIDWDHVLQEQKYEIIYTDDMIEAFFLHIQGSGIVEMGADRMYVNYSAPNGHPYVAIGSVLRDEGVPYEYRTLQGLRQYFKDFPDEIDRVLPMNPSYIFFQSDEVGPFGSSGAALTDGYSIATDRAYWPQGSVALIQTQRPLVENEEITEWKEFSRLVVNQDTGGAIKGAGRVDIFWGSGDYAEWAAGNLAHSGSLYFAVPKR